MTVTIPPRAPESEDERSVEERNRRARGAYQGGAPPCTTSPGGLRTETAAYASDDRGFSWRRLGRQVLSDAGLAVDPRAPDTLYGGASDGGVTWTHGNACLADHLNAAAADPKKLLVAGVGASKVAIDPVDPETLYAATRDSIRKSVDGGATWVSADLGVTMGDIDALAVDPRSPRVLYVAGDGGMFRSTDGARSWHRLEHGVAGPHVRSFAVAADGRTIFAGTLGHGVIEIRLRG